ncbi:IclR family transcriptional regulator [Burkholderia diffusa]|uniref:IclR family transcriptional regulator n=1 Tax=Burkholderia diffusa TaxID=488732 RepID=UPI001583F2AE|nr:IclR family transcriptional regulator [Burkholderia diffusa]
MSSLENASAILQLLTRLRRAVTVSDVVQHLGMPKSSASRLLKQMGEQMLLERDPGTLAYGPALMLLELAHMVRASTPLLSMMDKALSGLCEQTGHTGYISVLDRQEVVVLRVHPGIHPLRLVTFPGQRGPAWAGATGRALLARETDQAIVRLFADGLPPAAPAAPDSVNELLRRVTETRRTGFSVALDESLPGIGAVGCAVGDPSSGESLAFSLTFPLTMSSPSEVDRLAAMAREQACLIGRTVGDPFWSTESVSVA